MRGSSLLSSSCCHVALRGHLSSDRRGETMPAHSSQQNKGELRAKPPLPNSGTVSAAATCVPCPCSDSCATSSQRMLSEGHRACLAFATTGRVCANDDDHVATRSSGSSPPRADGLNSGGHACQAVSAWPLHHSHPWKMYPAQGQSPGPRACLIAVS